MSRWLELTLSESYEALWFCPCTEDTIDLEEQDDYIVCLHCGVWRRVGTLKRDRPRIVLNG
jgi:hypothetical protein